MQGAGKCGRVCKGILQAHRLERGRDGHPDLTAMGWRRPAGCRAGTLTKLPGWNKGLRGMVREAWLQLLEFGSLSGTPDTMYQPRDDSWAHVLVNEQNYGLGLSVGPHFSLGDDLGQRGRPPLSQGRWVSRDRPAAIPQQWPLVVMSWNCPCSLKTTHFTNR